MMPPGTGMMGPGMGGSVLASGIKVDDRPVTGATSGMMGMKTAAQALKMKALKAVRQFRFCSCCCASMYGTI